jgi:hypothetical protein
MWGMGGAVTPADAERIESTVDYADQTTEATDESPAVEINELKTDPNPLLSLGSRAISSNVSGGVKPLPPSARGQTVDVGYVNDRIPVLGHAAGEEAAGVWGCRNIQHIAGMEPTIGEGRCFPVAGYFDAHGIDGRPIQENIRRHTEVIPDSDQRVLDSAKGQQRTHLAKMTSVYETWYEGTR